MTPVLTSTALALHDLGLAAGFGGSLFGRLALNPSVKEISSKEERGRVVNAAWNGYNIINGLALGTTALTWLIGRSALSGREFGRDVRRWVIAKDIFLGSTLVTGLYGMISGRYLAGQVSLPVEAGAQPAPETPSAPAQVQKSLNVIGILNLISAAGVIATTAVLNNKAASSRRWRFLSRNILP
jgi:hypothetical protein